MLPVTETPVFAIQVSKDHSDGAFEEKASQLTGIRKSTSLILQTCNRNNIHSILTFICKRSHSA